MIITLDFDGTLSREDVQEYVKQLIANGHDIWILTSRYDDLHAHNYTLNPKNDDLYQIAYLLNIPKHQIIFTNMLSKYEFLFNSIVDVHVENDTLEIEEILHYTKTNCIDVNKENWIENANFIIKGMQCLTE